MTREQLIDRILDLETALYPFTRVLSVISGPIENDPIASSKLFPERTEEGFLYTYNQAGEPATEYKGIPNEKLHDIEYETTTGIVFSNNGLLDDKFPIIHFHQSYEIASMFSGDICVGDVRHAQYLMNRKD